VLENDFKDLMERKKQAEKNRSAEYLYDEMLRKFEYSKIFVVD